MTRGFTCTADARCRNRAHSAGGVCDERRWQARLAQLWHSPSVAVRAAAWLLTRLHQPAAGPGGDEPGCRGPSRAAAREAEPG
jgi:hypothetical protein